MLETLIVYGLILLFFVLLAVFVGVVLTTHPYVEPSSSVQSVASTKAPAKAQTVRRSSGTGNGAAYGIIAALFLLFCVITVLDQRSHTRS